jgi:hypothetical protein
VRLCDRTDYRQAESRSTGAAAFVGAAESLERSRQKRGRKACSFVRHVHLDVRVAFDRKEPDGTRAIAQRVLDEIGKRLSDPEPVGGDPDATTATLDRPAGITGATLESSHDPAQNIVQLDGLPPKRKDTVVETSEQQQILGELRETVGLNTR